MHFFTRSIFQFPIQSSQFEIFVESFAANDAFSQFKILMNNDLFVFFFDNHFVFISQFENGFFDSNIFSSFVFDDFYSFADGFIFISQFKDVFLLISNFSLLNISNDRISDDFWAKYSSSMSINDFEKCDVLCLHCQALHWKMKTKVKNTSYSKCCKNGKINLLSMSEFFSLLRELFIIATSQTRQFWKIIWKYNNAVVFTSVKTDSNKQLKSNSNNSQFFQIHDELFHKQDSLNSSNFQSVYVQWIFHDFIYVARRVHECESKLNMEFFKKLYQMLYTCCSYINVYKMVKKFLFKQNRDHFEVHVIFDPQLKLVIEKKTNRQRENLFVVDEIMILILNVFSDWTDPWNLIFTYRHFTRRGFQNIHLTHFFYMSLAYSLFFSRENKNWHWNL